MIRGLSADAATINKEDTGELTLRIMGNMISKSLVLAFESFPNKVWKSLLMREPNRRI